MPCLMNPVTITIRMTTAVSANVTAIWLVTVKEPGRRPMKFEVAMNIAEFKGTKNAFWVTRQDHYEIDTGDGMSRGFGRSGDGLSLA